MRKTPEPSPSMLVMATTGLAPPTSSWANAAMKTKYSSAVTHNLSDELTHCTSCNGQLTSNVERPLSIAVTDRSWPHSALHRGALVHQSSRPCQTPPTRMNIGLAGHCLIPELPI